MTGCRESASMREDGCELKMMNRDTVFVYYSLVSDENITVALNTDRKQCLWSPVFTDLKGICEGKRSVSSPGWRFWTVCFGLCVFWPATLCSRHAATRPRTKCSISSHRWRPEKTRGPEKTNASPLCLCVTFNNTFNSFYCHWWPFPPLYEMRHILPQSTSLYFSEMPKTIA